MIEGREWDKAVDKLLVGELKANERTLSSATASQAAAAAAVDKSMNEGLDDGILEDDGPFTPPHTVEERRGRCEVASFLVLLFMSTPMPRPLFSSKVKHRTVSSSHMLS